MAKNTFKNTFRKSMAKNKYLINNNIKECKYYYYNEYKR